MTRKRIILNRLIVTAPWLTLVVLLGLSQVLPNRSTITPEAIHRQKEVKAALEAVPRFIGQGGRWIGQDAQVPPEAQQLLRPNGILMRMYQRAGHPDVHVLVVHCSDARDMTGHYPPICYPMSGWIDNPLAGEPEELVLNVEGRRLPVRLYGFRGIGEQGNQTVIRIFNAFILPDGTITPEIDDIHRQSERLAVSVQGVAQLQVITPGGTRLEDALSAAEEILGGMTAMFDALGVKEGASNGS